MASGKRFTVLTSFESPELKSHYVAGHSYTIKDGNEKLARLAAQWKDEGKIVFGGTTAAKVSGHD